MWRNVLAVLVSSWLASTPALWTHRTAQAIIAFAAGTLGVTLSVSAVVVPRLLPAVALIGAILAVSVYAFPDSLVTTVHNTVVATLLIMPSLAPRVKSGVAVARQEAVQDRFGGASGPIEIAHQGVPESGIENELAAAPAEKVVLGQRR